MIDEFILPAVFVLPPAEISAAAILVGAAILDYLIGDPWGWPHPVRFMGLAISWFSQLTIKQRLSEWQQRFAGIVLGMGLILGSWLAGWLIVLAASWLHPIWGIISASILLASCFAGRSLRSAAVDVLQPLTTGNLESACGTLSQYVGRDTDNLSESEILRAVLETVTENATDGVMAPLFYAIAGVSLTVISNNFFPTSMPSPFLLLPLAYKAASTLDSMVGYRQEPYTYLGWFSAKLEDYLTWIPCRLTVITLALLSGKPIYVWQLCQRDAIKDPSPNSGWSECAYAAILGVQVGGINWYQGIAKNKPLLGEPVHPITAATIYQALQLTRYCFLIWLGSAMIAFLTWQR